MEELDARNYPILRNRDQSFLWGSSTPHFHAIYGEYNALVNIESLEILEGDLPNRAEKLVLEWAALYQKELLSMWNSQEFTKLPPLK